MITIRFTAANEKQTIDFIQLNRLIKQLAGFSPPHNQKSWTQFLNQESLHQLIAVEDNGNKLIGLASLFVIEKIEYRTGLIEGLVVDQTYRHQGIGKQMMQKLVEQGRRLQLKQLDLTSNPTRLAANRFYQKFGFRKRETNVYRLLISNQS